MNSEIITSEVAAVAILMLIAAALGFLGGARAIMWHMLRCCHCKRQILQLWQLGHGHPGRCQPEDLHIHHPEHHHDREPRYRPPGPEAEV